MTPTYHIMHLTSGHEAFDTRIVAKQCAGLVSQGYLVTLVARKPLDAEWVMPEGVRLLTVPRPKGRIDRFVNTARQIAQIAQNESADLYHFHDPDLLPHMISLAKSGAKVIYDVHEDYRSSAYDRHWIPKFMRGFFGQAISRLENRMGELGWICAATPDIANFFEPDRTVLVQNFPSLSEIDLGQTSIPYSDREVSLIYVGAVTQERGITEIVDALPRIAAEIPNFRFDLIGPISNTYYENLKSRPGWQWVQYHGRKNRAGVADSLGRAKVGLVTLRNLPRYQASQPTKLYEYMAARLPVIASDFPRWKAQVGENIGTFVDPIPEAIAEAAITLLKNPEIAIAKGLAGRRIVEENFSWEADQKRLHDFYNHILTP